MDSIFIDWQEYGSIALRLGFASLLAAIPGAQRRFRAQPAGLRTHMIISLGACLFMLVSLRVPKLVDGLTGDPGRIAAQVVTGMGFLGAGAILREGVSIRGLTTAASLWMCSAIGLAIGAGMYPHGIIAAILLYLTLSFFDVVERRLFTKGRIRKLRVNGHGGAEELERIPSLLIRCLSPPSPRTNSPVFPSRRVICVRVPWIKATWAHSPRPRSLMVRSFMIIFK